MNNKKIQVFEIIPFSRYKLPSMARMMKIDEEIAAFEKSGKIRTVFYNVKWITFKKNGTSRYIRFVYIEKGKNVIKEIFEISFGKIVEVVSWDDQDLLMPPEGVQIIK